MKTFRIISMAALALMLAACSNDENDLAQQGMMHFTATIEAPNGDATTRTTYTNYGTSIDVVWKVGDEIALVHNGVKDVATVTAVDGSGNATIDATITGSPSDNDDVALVYPAAIVSTVTDGTTYTRDLSKLMTQDGTLAYIQDNLDIRSATGKLAVGGSGASLKQNVKLASMIAIWKLTLTNDQHNPINATEVTLNIGPNPVVSAQSAGQSEYYLCTIPDQMVGDLTIEANVNKVDYYIYPKANGVTLVNGKYYQSTIPMHYIYQTFISFNHQNEGYDYIYKYSSSYIDVTGPISNMGEIILYNYFDEMVIEVNTSILNIAKVQFYMDVWNNYDYKDVLTTSSGSFVDDYTVKFVNAPSLTIRANGSSVVTFSHAIVYYYAID